MKYFGFLAILFLAFSTASCNRDGSEEMATTSIYIAAHADDWQLFMGENAYADLNDEHTKSLFILVTAGDAAKGTGTDEGANLPYYKARERGFLNGIMWADQSQIKLNKEGRANLPLQSYNLSETTINGHVLQKFIYGRSVTYILNLPDGFPQGQYKWSLQKLYENKIDSIPAIDKSASYTSWRDLQLTLQRIYEQEVAVSTDVVLNLAERDSTINPKDHSDHIFASLLGEQAAIDLNPTIRYYNEYVILDKAANLSQEQVKAKKLIFSANASSKEAAGYPSPWDERHTKFLERSYWREIKPAQ